MQIKYVTIGKRYESGKNGKTTVKDKEFNTNRTGVKGEVQYNAKLEWKKT